jgi:hypothetical protein
MNAEMNESSSRHSLFGILLEHSFQSALGVPHGRLGLIRR